VPPHPCTSPPLRATRRRAACAGRRPGIRLPRDFGVMQGAAGPGHRARGRPPAPPALQPRLHKYATWDPHSRVQSTASPPRKGTLAAGWPRPPLPATALSPAARRCRARPRRRGPRNPARCRANPYYTLTILFTTPIKGALPAPRALGGAAALPARHASPLKPTPSPAPRVTDHAPRHHGPRTAAPQRRACRAEAQHSAPRLGHGRGAACPTLQHCVARTAPRPRLRGAGPKATRPNQPKAITPRFRWRPATTT
jgi:hypothetical protein